jgi:hypothetical protein
MPDKTFKATRDGPKKNILKSLEESLKNNLADKLDSENNKSKRMTIQLPYESAKNLEWLANSQGISQVEALRKAIATETYFQQEIQQGATVLGQLKDLVKQVIFR